MNIRINTPLELKKFVDQLKDGDEYPNEVNFDVERWLSFIDEYPDLHEIVLAYQVPPQILHHLAIVGNEKIRSRIACIRRLLPETFELLAKDSEDWIRMNIAANKKTPAYILNTLLKDSNKEVSRYSKYNLYTRKNKY